MTIFAINKNTFAIGTAGKRAAYVVRKTGKKVHGVRGQRPVLNDRYKKASPGKEIAAALKAGAEA
jgi:formylmethanofuran dehydrogenase subunit E